MSRKRAVPAGAARRQCPICHKNFKPMTDDLWRVNFTQHVTMSERHKTYLRLVQARATEIGRAVRQASSESAR